MDNQQISSTFPVEAAQYVDSSLKRQGNFLGTTKRMNCYTWMGTLNPSPSGTISSGYIREGRSALGLYTDLR